MTLIQSYVLNKYFVSTIHRESSVWEYDNDWYYETIVWEWDDETRKRGKMISQDYSGAVEIDALEEHFTICKKLMTNDSSN